MTLCKTHLLLTIPNRRRKSFKNVKLSFEEKLLVKKNLFCWGKIESQLFLLLTNQCLYVVTVRGVWCGIARSLSLLSFVYAVVSREGTRMITHDPVRVE